MLSVLAPKFCCGFVLLSTPRLPIFSSLNSHFPPKCLTCPNHHRPFLRSQSARQPRTQSFVFCSRSSEAEEEPSTETEDEWLTRLPEKKKALYSHSLPCIEAWLRDLGFYQSKDDRAVWLVEKPDWHAQMSLDVTDLYIRYLKSGPGNLEKDVERRFSYALSREDIENAILGGP
ncbi:hypothetical protein HS088_TW18G01097 [Tripterygium wilfordii]|uniref:Uncharacterized protein n=1 Tax=Tripterygium wilfordii TaxID=458696 RepID=A0A7J7CE72_TRIWF|nr:uncharacterized protein LOC119984595 [Tripterygium wilfordii]KAF5732402.1 hypothetical protein HS088_TW18G01097 [Tripterygium wilfordii]